MEDLEKRVAVLEAWRDSVTPYISRTKPLGPNPRRDWGLEERREAEFQNTNEEVKAREAPPVDRSAQQLVSGALVPEDRSHTKLKENGQQQDYVVLTPEERAKGFVRPVRRSYMHVGPSGPQYPLRDLEPATEGHFIASGYAKFEQYPESESPGTGRYWTQAQLDSVGKRCGTRTTMSRAIAETYARDPKFYVGTFCCGCGRHLPVDEFVWEGNEERVGS
jgi:hypothetical protein